MAKSAKEVKRKGKVKDVGLLRFALANYYRYGTAVLEDRAIPDFRDGLNPVNRRVLWAAHTLGINNKAKFVKSARIIGETLGRYHPHSDAGTYKAMIGMTNVGKNVNNISVNLFQGEGNWGTISSKQAAALRYTEARLSAFSDQVLFNKFYLPVVDKVPNFDSSTVEPLILPALLPLIFLNGRFGIAPGATTNIPSFDPKTVIKVLSKLYAGEELTEKLLRTTLRAVTTFGGVELNPKAKTRRDLFTKTKGSIHLTSVSEFDSKTRTLTVTGFAQDSIDSLLEACSVMPGVQTVQDLAEVKDKYGKVCVTLKKSVKGKDQEKLLATIQAKLTKKQNYVLNFTERSKGKDGLASAKMSAKTLVQVFGEWVQWRTELERSAAAYWMAEREKEIRKLELLLIAVKHRKVIIQSLDLDLSMDKLCEWLAKKLKITTDEAATIYELRVRQLRALEEKALLEAKRETEKALSDLNKRFKKPAPFMLSQLKELASLV